MINRGKNPRFAAVQIVFICFLTSVSSMPVIPAQDTAGVPVIQIAKEGSAVRFAVKASVSIEGTFDNWEATITYPSREAEAGTLDIKIRADSVNTGSGMKDDKLKSKDFFNAKEDPYITFHSTKFTETSPTTVEVQGNFTIRGVSKPETLLFDVTGKGTGVGEIKGTMAFDRKEFGMNSGIPFIKIADRVEVSVDLKGKRVSGPPLVFKR
jgi:polyisoprenoid-binding protein YceI